MGSQHLILLVSLGKGFHSASASLTFGFANTCKGYSSIWDYGNYNLNTRASERCLEETFEPKKVQTCWIELFLLSIFDIWKLFSILLLCVFLQEVQRNGKASIPAGRWPSLLSLTCPRSSGSGSGSELSLSSACSEYSSGSHTWAEGRGSSKQVYVTNPSSVTC